MSHVQVHDNWQRERAKIEKIEEENHSLREENARLNSDIERKLVVLSENVRTLIENHIQLGHTAYMCYLYEVNGRRGLRHVQEMPSEIRQAENLNDSLKEFNLLLKAIAGLLEGITDKDLPHVPDFQI